MIVIEYKYFDVISFDYSEDVSNRDDIIVANGVKDFVKQLRHLPIKKLEYLNYWNRVEHQRKCVLETYDNILENMLDIECRLIEYDNYKKTFIIRMKNVQKNYLRNSDLDIEFEKIISSILKSVDESVIDLNHKFDTKLDSLYKRTEIVITRNYEYCNQKYLNPNLKVKDRSGYSLSDVL